MKFYAVFAATSVLIFAQSAQAGSVPLPNIGGVRIVDRLFTPAIVEPNGFVAICLATNLDTVARDLSARIIDSRGADVTETSSCGTQEKAGSTCDSTAHFNNDLPLRCVVGTSGKAANLRGSMTTSSDSFPFASPGNLVVTAQ
jgi:hypothetical protein